tara:strand:+ start:162 stop:1865 length:1704 start_codon:yes stop_codon:yes gene_type:complete
MKFLKNILIFGIYFSSICSLISQEDIRSLNDSIRKYKEVEYQKAIKFGFQALNSFQDDDKISLDFVNTNYYLAETYFYLGELKTAFEYLTTSLELYELLSPSQRRNKNVIKPPWVLVIIGNVYYQKMKYNDAEKFYNEALNNFKLFDPEHQEEKYYGINTSLVNLSLIKRDQGEINASRDLLDQVFERRKKNGTPQEIHATYQSYIELFLISENEELLNEYFQKSKTFYEGMVSDGSKELVYDLYFASANRSYAEFLQSKGKLMESLNYLLVSRSLLNDIPNEIPKVNFDISNAYYSLGMNDKAKDLILENLKTKQITQPQKLDNYKLLEKIYINENSIVNLLNVKDSIIFLNEQPTYQFQEEEFSSLEKLILISEKQNDLRVSKIRNSRLTTIYIISFIILLLISVTLKFNFDLQKEKNKTLNFEKDKIKDELNLKQRELFSKINFISQRNEYLNRIKKQIGKESTSSSKIKSEISNITNSEKAYKDFDKMFSQVYPKFYKKLNISAKLSQTDIRLASYIKMNHSNNEIARISGISIRTVESQRYRLSKKLKLSNGEDLNSYILSI